MIHFIIMRTPMPKEWCLPFICFNKIVSHLCYMRCILHPQSFDHYNNFLPTVVFLIFIINVTYRSIARQLLHKHVPSETDS
jgi:hypothetical protein